MPELGRLPDVDETFTIAARSDSLRCGSAALMVRTYPITFRSHVACQASSSVSSKVVTRAVPALLTRQSSPPIASTAPATAASHPAAVERSTATPVAPIGPAASAGSREAIATRAPSATSRSAVASPIPALPPVTSTRRSVISRSMWPPSYDLAQMTRILLVPHGETDWNREERWQGQAGPRLNERGRLQAEAVAVRLLRF